MEVRVNDVVRFEAYYISNGKENVRISDKDYTGVVTAIFTERHVINFVRINIGSREVMVHKEDIIQVYP